MYFKVENNLQETELMNTRKTAVYLKGFKDTQKIKKNSQDELLRNFH